MEACSSAHHWARKLRALGLDARLIAAHFVSPYRMEGKSGKNDATDAAAICEAASRPSMRFVPVKTCEQQGVMSLHRVREGLKEERTACINRIRGVLAEFGLVFGKSPKALRSVLADVLEDAANELSPHGAAGCCSARSSTGASSTSTCAGATSQVGQHVRSEPGGQARGKDHRHRRTRRLGAGGRRGRLQAVQGGRQFGAWLGLVPRQNSSGGKTSLGRITKRGDDYLRTLLIQGAKSAVMSAAQARRPDLALAGAAARARRLAEGLRGDGQQERPHPVGGDDARARLRSPPRQRQAARPSSPPRSARRLRGLIRHDDSTRSTNSQSFHEDVLSKMH